MGGGFFEACTITSHKCRCFSWALALTCILGVLRRGAKDLGWSSQEVPRFFKYEKHQGAYVGKRQSMRVTLIPRFRTAGGELLANTRVLKLDFKQRRAVAAMAQTTDPLTGKTKKLSTYTMLFEYKLDSSLPLMRSSSPCCME